MIDKEVQKQTLRRIKIIQGQLRGLQNMIAEGQYCVDVLTQISAVHEALRGVGKIVVRNHLQTCVTRDFKKNTGEKHYDEMMDIIYKLSK